MRAIRLCILVAVAVALAPISSAAAHFSSRKAIWGPVRVQGVSQFPIYRDLGAGMYEYALRWDSVAPSRPLHPRDPSDPAYHWPAELSGNSRDDPFDKLQKPLHVTAC